MRKFLYILAGLLGLIVLAVPSYFLYQKHYGSIQNNSRSRDTGNEDNDNRGYDGETEQHVKFSIKSYLRTEVIYPFNGPKSDTLRISVKFDDSNYTGSKIHNFYYKNFKIYDKESNTLIGHNPLKFLDEPTRCDIEILDGNYLKDYFPVENETQYFTDSCPYRIETELEINPSYKPEAIYSNDMSYEILSSGNLKLNVELLNCTGVTIRRLENVKIQLMGSYRNDTTHDEQGWGKLTEVQTLSDPIIFTDGLANQGTAPMEFIIPYSDYKQEHFSATSGYTTDAYFYIQVGTIVHD